MRVNFFQKIIFFRWYKPAKNEEQPQPSVGVVHMSFIAPLSTEATEKLSFSTDYSGVICDVEDARQARVTTEYFLSLHTTASDYCIS
jgi:hypothetical protein